MKNKEAAIRILGRFGQMHLRSPLDNLRGESNKENFSRITNVEESERMEEVVEVDSDEDEHQLTLKEILSNDNNNETVNIEDEPTMDIEPAVEPEPEKPEGRQFNVQRVEPLGVEQYNVYKDPSKVEKESTIQCTEKIKQIIRLLKRDKSEPKEPEVETPKQALKL